MLNEFAALRVRAGLSVEELALMTGYSVRQVQHWEAGGGIHARGRAWDCA